MSKTILDTILGHFVPPLPRSSVHICTTIQNIETHHQEEALVISLDGLALTVKLPVPRDNLVEVIEKFKSWIVDETKVNWIYDVLTRRILHYSPIKTQEGKSDMIHAHN
jgi:hypothetical protein